MRAKITAVGFALPLILSLTACGGTANTPPPSTVVSNPHPIQVERENRSISVAIGHGGHASVDENVLAAVAIDIVRRGHGPVEISGPREAATEVGKLLAAKGVRQGQILIRPVQQAHSVTVAFGTFRAIAPVCGEFESDAKTSGSGNTSNVDASEWGCSTAHNLAAMISDPSDLVRMSGTETVTDAGNASQRVLDGIRAYAVPKAPDVTAK